MEETPSEAPQLYSLPHLRAIRSLLLDPASRFSITMMQEKIAEIEEKLVATEDELMSCRGEIAFARGYLFMRQDRHDEASVHYASALEIDSVQPFIPAPSKPNIFRTLAKVLEQRNEWAAAAVQHRRAAESSLNPVTPREEMAGHLQEQAHCLHRAGQYQEALEINLDVHAQFEDHLPPDSMSWCGGLKNIAQNLHALGRAAETVPFLERWLDIATTNNNRVEVLYARHQLGVVHFELAEYDVARGHMNAAVAIATETGQQTLIKATTGWLEELNQRIEDAG